MSSEFQQLLKAEQQQFLAEQQRRFPSHETLKIDLHCHDFNSDVPDELTGRILNVPETFLPSETLIRELSRNGCNAYTITNHNNARPFLRDFSKRLGKFETPSAIGIFGVRRKIKKRPITGTPTLGKGHGSTIPHRVNTTTTPSLASNPTSTGVTPRCSTC